jgi:PBP1b-binding outer membrane lipoprotein LpoB
MYHKARISAIILISLFLIVISGCAYKTQRITDQSKSQYAPTNSSDVEIYEVGNNPLDSYEVLGKIFVRKKGSALNHGSPQDIKQDVQSLAAKMGADAVIGFYTSKLDDHEPLPYGCWGSGIAVKKKNTADPAKNTRPDFAVLMMSAGNRGALPFCQVHLEKKGYYAVPFNDQYKNLNIVYFDSLAIDSLLNTSIANNFAYILFFGVLSGDEGLSPEALVSHDYTNGQLGAALLTISNRMNAQSSGSLGNSKVSAYLYSVADQKIVWQETATGKQSIFLSKYGNVKGAETNAIKNLFKTLPFYNSIETK